MPWSLGLLFALFTSLVFAHGGDDGPASLEQEFSKQSHTHLPINFSSHDGITFGFEVGAHHEDIEEDHHDDHGAQFEAHPMISGGYDKIKRYLCLDEAKVIEACSPESPTVLFENKKWDLGLGLESHTHLPIALGVGVGVGYFKGKNYYSYKVLKNKNEKRQALKFPQSTEEFQQWRVGDQLAFMNKGSVLLSVVLGIDPFFHVGPEYTHTGIHRISVKKIDEKILVAEFSVIKSDSLALESSVIVANGGVGLSKGKSKTLNYEFAMDNDDAVKAFSYFLAGRLDLVNLEVQKGNVELHLDAQLKNAGRTLSGSLALPVLFVNGGYRGTYVSYGKLDLAHEGEMEPHEIFSASKVKDRFTRGVWSDHFWENQSLMTSILREMDDPTESIMSVALNWTFSKDHMKLGQFNRKMMKLARKTGIEKFKSLKLPAGTKGFVKIDVSLNLSADDVMKVLSLQDKHALEKFQSLKDYQGMNKKLLRIMNRYFKDDVSNLRAQVQVTLTGENLKKTVINF